jgi:hypothetical protein
VLGCQNDIRSSGYCVLSSPLKAKVEWDNESKVPHLPRFIYCTRESRSHGSKPFGPPTMPSRVSYKARHGHDFSVHPTPSSSLEFLDLASILSVHHGGLLQALLVQATTLGQRSLSDSPSIPQCSRSRYQKNACKLRG